MTPNQKNTQRPVKWNPNLCHFSLRGWNTNCEKKNLFEQKQLFWNRACKNWEILWLLTFVTLEKFRKSINLLFIIWYIRAKKYIKHFRGMVFASSHMAMAHKMHWTPTISTQQPDKPYHYVWFKNYYGPFGTLTLNHKKKLSKCCNHPGADLHTLLTFKIHFPGRDCSQKSMSPSSLSPWVQPVENFVHKQFCWMISMIGPLVVIQLLSNSQFFSLHETGHLQGNRVANTKTRSPKFVAIATRIAISARWTYQIWTWSTFADFKSLGVYVWCFYTHYMYP